MNAPDDYCEMCDLPRSTCIHGRPPVVAEKKAKAPTPRKRQAPVRAKRSASPAAGSPATRTVAPRLTAADVFKPLIVTMLEEAGGTLETEDALAMLELLTEGSLHSGDHERMPTGELRWQYAARRAQIALIDEGVLKKAPGLWQLSGSR